MGSLSRNVERQSMKRIAPILALLVALSGCASVSTIEISDRGLHSGEGDRFFSKGQTLFVEFDPLGSTMVAAVEPIVYKGDLYLGTISISGGQPMRFEIDVSPLGLGPDWVERVYVYSGSWDEGIPAFFHKGPLPQHTERWRVEVRPLDLRGG